MVKFFTFFSPSHPKKRLPLMKKMTKLDFKYLALLSSVTTFMLVFFGQIPYQIAPYATKDLSWYQRIAAAAPGIDASVHQPFAFRLLGPYLAGLMPLPEAAAFRILTLISLFVLVFLFYYLLRQVGIRPLSALACVLCLTLSRYCFGVYAWDFFHINDVLALIFTMMLFLAMWHKRWLSFGLILFLGAFTRETVMLMLPVALVYLWESRELRTHWRKLLLAAVPALSAILLIRLFWPIGGGTSLTEALALHAEKLYEPESLFRLWINTFLPFTLIPLVYFRATLEFFKTRLHLLAYVLLVFATTLFGSNQERLMSPAFIVFFMLLGSILDYIPAKKFTLGLMLAAGFASSFHPEMGIWQVPDNSSMRILSLSAAAMLTLFVLYNKLQATPNHAANLAHKRAKQRTRSSSPSPKKHVYQ